LLRQQQAEEKPPTKSAFACPVTLNVAGIVPTKRRSGEWNWQFTRVDNKKTTNAEGAKSDQQKHRRYVMKQRQTPKVLPLIKDSDVKRRTGFAAASDLIAYVITICNADFDRIQKRTSSLTWFEEWFLFFEWSYGHTCVRQCDLAAVWGLEENRYTINKIIDCKLALEMAAMQSWPRFAAFEEDKALRKSSKWSSYDGERVIMWDMTNVSAVKFDDAILQRATYSEYYAENCFKGGVGVQLCGWLVVEDLWGGGVSDTDYNLRSGYLRDQQQFQDKDLVFDDNNVVGRIVRFVILLDRGYRAKSAAWKHGKQLTLQPPSSRSDERFRGRKTVYAATVAHDRSGNERGVNVSKRSGLMKRGFHHGMNPIRFNCVWKCWAFRANFMYKPVL
jgi:hypothetical protein